MEMVLNRSRRIGKSVGNALELPIPGEYFLYISDLIRADAFQWIASLISMKNVSVSDVRAKLFAEPKF